MEIGMWGGLQICGGESGITTTTTTIIIILSFPDLFNLKRLQL